MDLRGQRCAYCIQPAWTRIENNTINVCKKHWEPHAAIQAGNTKLTFGKYKDRSVWWVYDEDEAYLDWILSPGFKPTKDQFPMVENIKIYTRFKKGLRI